MLGYSYKGSSAQFKVLIRTIPWLLAFGHVPILFPQAKDQKITPLTSIMFIIRLLLPLMCLNLTLR